MSHKQVLVIRKDLNMRKGKIAAQAAHASITALLSMASIEGNTLSLELDDRIAPWLSGDFKKITVYVNSEAELLAIHNAAQNAGLITSLILDSGLTEFKGVPTYTAVAVGPDTPEKIDSICGNLPLL